MLRLYSIVFTLFLSSPAFALNNYTNDVHGSLSAPVEDVTSTGYLYSEYWTSGAETLHPGLDLNTGDFDCPGNEPRKVYAIADGEVLYSDLGSSTWGGIVLIKHKYIDGFRVYNYLSQYAHIIPAISRGEKPKKGDIIGYIARGANTPNTCSFESLTDNSGNDLDVEASDYDVSWDAHLHFEIRWNAELSEEYWPTFSNISDLSRDTDENKSKAVNDIGYIDPVLFLQRPQILSGFMDIAIESYHQKDGEILESNKNGQDNFYAEIEILNRGSSDIEIEDIEIAVYGLDGVHVFDCWKASRDDPAVIHIPADGVYSLGRKSCEIYYAGWYKIEVNLKIDGEWDIYAAGSKFVVESQQDSYEYCEIPENQGGWSIIRRWLERILGGTACAMEGPLGTVTADYSNNAVAYFPSTQAVTLGYTAVQTSISQLEPIDPITSPGPAPILGTRSDVRPDFDIFDESGNEVSANSNTYTPKQVLVGERVQTVLTTQVSNADVKDSLRDSDSNSIEGPIWWKIEGVTGWHLLISEEFDVDDLDENDEPDEKEWFYIPNYPGETIVFKAAVDGDDEVLEENEGSRAKIYSPSDCGTNNCSRDERLRIVGNTPVTVDIEPEIRIAAIDSYAQEQGTNTAQFALTRYGPNSLPTPVLYDIGGTAGNGTDYEVLPSSATFPAGSVDPIIITITAIDDSSEEPEETVTLTLLSSPGVYTLSESSSATIVIVDDDAYEPDAIVLPFYENFEDVTHSWQLEDHHASAIMDNMDCGNDQGRCLHVFNNAVQTYSYEVQAELLGLPLQHGQAYRGRIRLKTDREEGIAIKVHRDVDPYDTFGLNHWCVADTQWRTCTFDFVADNHPENDAGNVRFSLYLGEISGNIWIDDFELEAKPNEIIPFYENFDWGVHSMMLERPYNSGVTMQTSGDCGSTFGGCLIVTNDAAYPNTTDVQAKQVGFEIEQGKEYQGQLRLKTEQPSTVPLALVLDVPPYDNLGLRVDCTTGYDWTACPFYFTPQGTDQYDGKNIRFTVKLGRIPGQTIIDEIKLQPVYHWPVSETFDDADHGWLLEDHAPSATMEALADCGSSQGGCLQVSNSAVQDYGYFVQAELLGVDIEYGERYQGQIRLRSEQAASITVGFWLGVDPYDNLGMWEQCQTGPTWTTCSFDFVAAVDKPYQPMDVRFAVQMGKVPGKVWIDDLWVERVEVAPPPQPPVLPINQDFEGSHGWILEDHHGSAVMQTLADCGSGQGACLYVDNSVAQTYDYEVQAKLLGVDLKNGHRYTGKILLRAEYPGPIDIGAYMNVEPYTYLGLWATCNVGAAWTTCDLDFTAEIPGGVSPEDIRIAVMLGDVPGGVWIDDFQLTEADGSGCREGSIVEGDVTYPTNAEIKATGEIATSGLVVVNSGLDVQYRAEKVTLRPGFHAKAGSTFTAVAEQVSCRN